MTQEVAAVGHSDGSTSGSLSAVEEALPQVSDKQRLVGSISLASSREIRRGHIAADGGDKRGGRDDLRTILREKPDELMEIIVKLCYDIYCSKATDCAQSVQKT